MRIVDEMKLELGKSDDLDMPWSQVSQRMGHMRSRQQCSTKWYDCIISNGYRYNAVALPGGR
jgi:hypothetical protein